MNRFLFWLAERICRLRRITRDHQNPYLDRYYLFGGPASRWFLALHRIHRSDSDAALHNHPWPFAALMLSGFYMEQQPSGIYKRRPGYLRWRGRSSLHRLVLPRGECWSLFLGGPRRGSWGFKVGGTVVDHKKYLTP